MTLAERWAALRDVSNACEAARIKADLVAARRDQMIRDLYAADPEASLRVIAGLAGISHQAVSKIVNRSD